MTNIEAKLVQPTARFEADVQTARPMDCVTPGQRFLPNKVIVRYSFAVGGAWVVSSIYIRGPIVRKQDGSLSTRDGYRMFGIGAPLSKAPTWASDFADSHMPGGVR